MVDNVLVGRENSTRDVFDGIDGKNNFFPDGIVYNIQSTKFDIIRVNMADAFFLRVKNASNLLGGGGSRRDYAKIIFFSLNCV